MLHVNRDRADAAAIKAASARGYMELILNSDNVSAHVCFAAIWLNCVFSGTYKAMYMKMAVIRKNKKICIYFVGLFWKRKMCMYYMVAHNATENEERELKSRKKNKIRILFLLGNKTLDGIGHYLYVVTVSTAGKHLYSLELYRDYNPPRCAH